MRTDAFQRVRVEHSSQDLLEGLAQHYAAVVLFAQEGLEVVHHVQLPIQYLREGTVAYRKQPPLGLVLSVDQYFGLVA